VKHPKDECYDHRSKDDEGHREVEFHEVHGLALLSLSLPSGFGSPSRTLAALGGRQLRRPSVSTFGAPKVTTHNRRRVLRTGLRDR
jgi:hypothetical protein